MPTPPLKPMRAFALALCIASLVVFAPLWAPLVLAAWFADFLRPAVRKLERLLGGRRRAAGALVVLVVVGVLLPLGGLAAALTSAIRDLLGQVRAALEGQGSLAGALLGGGDGAHPATPDWADLATRHGANAWRALSVVARASATAVIGILVFIAALYTFAVDGERSYAWLQRNAPIHPTALARLVVAFRETGRGLLVSGGGTALVQGALATAAYVAIGIPRALILGPITAVCALVPIVGTGLVWVPLAIELGISGHYRRAAAVVAMDTGVGLLDNFIRPMLTRYGPPRAPDARRPRRDARRGRALRPDGSAPRSSRGTALRRVARDRGGAAPRSAGRSRRERGRPLSRPGRARYDVAHVDGIGATTMRLGMAVALLVYAGCARHPAPSSTGLLFFSRRAGRASLACSISTRAIPPPRGRAAQTPILRGRHESLRLDRSSSSKSGADEIASPRSDRCVGLERRSPVELASDMGRVLRSVRRGLA